MAGYDVKYGVFNTMEHGNLPQNRERVYIVGFRKETKLIDKFKFPKPLSLTKRIEDLLEQSVNDTYYYNSKPLFEKIKDYPFKTGVVYQWRRKYIRENKSGVSPTLTANM